MPLLGFRYSPIAWAAATGLVMTLYPPPSAAAPLDELITKCDSLASDAKDPEAYAAPVEDSKVARGATVAACGAAVAANPDFARGWYELGRAHHLAGHDADAFHAFAKATTLGYAAAMSAIGDAYFTGRGLPSDEQQSTEIALGWYKKSIDAGNIFAKDAYKNAQKAISESKFDSSSFQNPEYISNLYDGDAFSVKGPERAHFLYYVHAFAETLGGETVFFIDQDCQQYIRKFNLVSIEIEANTLITHSMMGNGDILKDGINFNNPTMNGVIYDQDNGKRDAKTLMKSYSCKSPIVVRITETISRIGDTPVTGERIGAQYPGPIGEALGKILDGTYSLPRR